MKKVILDLCGGSGNWSSFYRADSENYKVFVLDRQKNGTDIRLLEKQREGIHGILCAPPCTVFSRAGNHIHRDAWEMREGLSVLDACFRIVWVEKPKFWAIENPSGGKLGRFLGREKLKFNPCDYGDAYLKQTSLWGEFNLPLVTPVFPVEQDMADVISDQAERSITPLGFAKAFYLANP